MGSHGGGAGNVFISDLEAPWVDSSYRCYLSRFVLTLEDHHGASNGSHATTAATIELAEL